MERLQETEASADRVFSLLAAQPVLLVAGASGAWRHRPGRAGVHAAPPDPRASASRGKGPGPPPLERLLPGGRSPGLGSSSSSASSSLSSSLPAAPSGDRARDEGARRGTTAHLCHQKSSPPGTACLEQLLEPPPLPPRAEPAQPGGAADPGEGPERGSSGVSDRWAQPEPGRAGHASSGGAIGTPGRAREGVRVGVLQIKQREGKVLTCPLT